MKFDIYYATKSFPFNGSFVPVGYFYGVVNNKPFISNGVLCKNGAVCLNIRRNGEWVEKWENSSLSRALVARRRENDRQAEALARNTYNSMAYVKKPKTYYKLDQ